MRAQGTCGRASAHHNDPFSMDFLRGVLAAHYEPRVRPSDDGEAEPNPQGRWDGTWPDADADDEGNTP